MPVVHQRQIDEILAEICKIRERVAKDVTQLLDLSRKLSDLVRRDPQLTMYLPFANAWVRFSGMVLLGMRRTIAFDRYTRVSEKPEYRLTRRRAPVQYLPPKDASVEIDYQAYLGEHTRD